MIASSYTAHVSSQPPSTYVFNNPHRTLKLSMLVALCVSAGINAYSILYVTGLQLFSAQQDQGHFNNLRVVLVPAEHSVNIETPTISKRQNSNAGNSGDAVKDAHNNHARYADKPHTDAQETNQKSANVNNLVSQFLEITTFPVQPKHSATAAEHSATDIAGTNVADNNTAHGNTAINKAPTHNVTKHDKAAVDEIPSKNTGLANSVDKPPMQLRRTQSGGKKLAPRGIQPLYKLTRMPEFAHKEQPAYPENERITGVESTVIAAATIDRRGIVKDVQIVQTGGSNFDDAVIAALYKSLFFPAYIDNLAVATRLQVPYEFELK